MLQKSFVCSTSCWGCIGSVLTGDIDLISEHLTLPTPLLLSLILSAVTSFWPKLGSEENPTGSLPDAQCLGSLGNLIRCQKKKVRIISVLFCLGPARKAKYSKVLSWPHAEGHVQSARSQFFPRIIFNPFIDVLYIHQVV